MLLPAHSHTVSQAQSHTIPQSHLPATSHARSFAIPCLPSPSLARGSDITNSVTGRPLPCRALPTDPLPTMCPPVSLGWGCPGQRPGPAFALKLALQEQLGFHLSPKDETGAGGLLLLEAEPTQRKAFVLGGSVIKRSQNPSASPSPPTKEQNSSYF